MYFLQKDIESIPHRFILLFSSLDIICKENYTLTDLQLLRSELTNSCWKNSIPLQQGVRLESQKLPIGYWFFIAKCTTYQQITHTSRLDYWSCWSSFTGMGRQSFGFYRGNALFQWIYSHNGGYRLFSETGHFECYQVTLWHIMLLNFSTQ